MDGAREEVEKIDFGAFIDKFDLLPPSKDSLLPLHGLTFAVKDIFDIAGYVTGFGNPDWAKTHTAATSTSPVVLSTIEAGATCIGKTVMDEMAYSINGENKHYGTPINPSAPDRVPGGSSSGSAVAVAAKLVDFSFGTDTGGSVRVPASYCGIFGIRPSHGVVSTSGVIPMAQTFDTVGWFARDPKIMNNVGHVLLPLSPMGIIPPRRVIIPDDCFEKLSFLSKIKYWTETNHHYDWRGVAPRSQYISNLLKELDYGLKAATTATWKIVVGHHTIRSVSEHGETVELVQLLLPILKANDVDLYVNGHDHCLEHISSTDSPIQFLTSGGGSKAWRGVYKSTSDKLRFFYDGQGFMSVQLSPTVLKIAFYDVFGDVLYDWSLTKEISSSE